MSRGRLPGDDDALPPPRRGTSSGEYPAGAAFPAAGSRPGGAYYPDPAYPDAGYPGAPDYPESGGTGAYPADSSRSDPAGASSAWSSPGRSVWEPEPGRGSTPAARHPGTGYPESGYPESGYPESGYPDGEYAGSEYPAGDYPVPGDDAPGPYSGTEYPGPDYPAPGDYPGRRAHVARGREAADEPGEGDW